MEIILGIIIAIYWIWKDERYKHYDDEDWEKIKNDTIKRINRESRRDKWR